MEKKRFSVHQIPGLFIATIMGIPIVEESDIDVEERQISTCLNGKNGNGATHDTAYTKTPNGIVARRSMRREHPSGK